jgi:hypothetical protein
MRSDSRRIVELLVIFSRDGESDDARIVANGERAAKVAILMIASRDGLHAGDQLLVQHYVPSVTPFRLKDVTGALRARRYRRRQKANRINAGVTVSTPEMCALAARLGSRRCSNR